MRKYALFVLCLLVSAATHAQPQPGPASLPASQPVVREATEAFPWGTLQSFQGPKKEPSRTAGLTTLSSPALPKSPFRGVAQETPSRFVSVQGIRARTFWAAAGLTAAGSLGFVYGGLNNNGFALVSGAALLSYAPSLGYRAAGETTIARWTTTARVLGLAGTLYFARANIARGDEIAVNLLGLTALSSWVGVLGIWRRFPYPNLPSGR